MSDDQQSDLAQRLLDAQVEFHKRQLLGSDEFEQLVVEEVDNYLAGPATMTLNESMDPDLVKAVAHKYAIQVPVEGAIPELVGEIAARLHAHTVNDETRVGDVIDERRFDELATAIADLDITHRLIGRILDSPVTIDICVEIMQRAVDSAIESGDVDEASGLPDRLRRSTSRAAQSLRPAIDGVVERVTRTGAKFVVKGNRSGTDDLVLGTANELWRKHSDSAVGLFNDLVSDGDIEDIVVVVFEFWRDFRHTEYFGALLDEGIDHVFDKYGDTALVELLSELGVERADLIEEAIRFAPLVISRLDERGYLDTLVRRRVAPFFESPEFRAAVSG